MMRVHSLRRISWQHPSQWKGLTEDGRPVFVRYKWGELSILIDLDGDGEAAHGGSRLFEMDVGHRHDCQIDWQQVQEVTGIVVEAPCQIG